MKNECQCHASANVNKYTAEHWKETLYILLQGYEQKNCFNVDGTGVLYKLLPAKPSAQKGNHDMVAEVSKNATLQLQRQWEIKAICDHKIWLLKYVNEKA
jgi:hypothetical protein